MAKELHVAPGERAEILQEIEKNTSDIDVARSKGDQQKLLSQLEKGLYLRRRLYQEASEEVAAACHRLCEACNVVGQSLLQQEHLKGAHELLKRAEEVAERNPRDKAITWNNLACYYRRVGKLRVAVTLLERALEIEEYASPDEATQTHLNLCATLSQLNRHAEALSHAKSAMIRLYEILSPMMIDGKFSKRPLDEEQSEQVLVLCIAYHNCAVENEYLKQYEAAMRAYMEGYDYATKFLSPDHQLIEIMKSSIEALKSNLKAGSLALARAEEILAGSARQENVAIENENASEGMQLGHLMTPRGTRRVTDEAVSDDLQNQG
jgi:tetratricopeptide (TPR) repeat protein